MGEVMSRGLAILLMIGMAIVLAPLIIIFSQSLIGWFMGTEKDEEEELKKQGDYKNKDSALWSEADVDAYLQDIGMK
jgi:Na+-transporting methylmalonyl-CoA/oxaloacetate decarboxylase gamma subunit